MAGEPRAQPLSSLSQSGLGVTAAPTAGQGLALTPAGRVPFSALAEPWQYPADLSLYQNSWADSGTGIFRVRFRKVAGIVFWEGQPTRTPAPSAGSLILGPLPIGYWPQNSLVFMVPDILVNGGTQVFTTVTVGSNGITWENSNSTPPLVPHLVFSYSPYVP